MATRCFYISRYRDFLSLPKSMIVENLNANVVSNDISRAEFENCLSGVQNKSALSHHYLFDM